MKNLGLFIIGCTLLASCLETESQAGRNIDETVMGFADAYFNYDFKKAMKFVTPETAKWLYFASTNVTQQDIDLMNEADKETTTEIIDYDQTDDSTQIVTIAVENVLLMNTIGQPSDMVDKAEFRLPVVCREGRYMVKMEGLPRSERRSRD